MNELESINEEKQKKQEKIILIACIALMLFLVLGVILYPFVVVKPKKIFTTTIDKAYTLANQNNKENITTLGEKFSFQTSLTSKDQNQQKILDIFNQIKIQLDYSIDYEQEKMIAKLQSSYKEKDMLNLSVHFIDKEIYAYLDDIYNQYIQLETKGLEEISFNQNRIKDYQVVLEQVQKALKKSLKDKYFTKENTKIKLNDKETKVTKNSLLLTEKNINEIIPAFTKELNNDTFIKSYASLSGQTEEDIKKDLEKLTKKSYTQKENMTISLYTRGIKNTFVGLEIEVDSNKILLIKEQETEYSYEIKGKDISLNGKVIIEKADNQINLNVTILNDTISGNIVLSFQTDKNITIPDIDLNQSIESSIITKKEQEKIITNLQNQDGIKELLKDLENLFNSQSFTNTLDM